MIYPIKNNETVLPSKKNICILFNGSITIKQNDLQTSIPSKSYFLFDKPFDIIAASPYLEGFVSTLDTSFLKQHQDIEKILNPIKNYFESKNLKNVEFKKNTIKSILNVQNNAILTQSYTHILWSELLTEYLKNEEELTTIEKFHDLVDQNLEQNYCAGTYAEMIGVPLKKLIKEVKKYEQKTPCNFITEKVIDKAKHKLVNTNDTVQMIAYQLGFNDPFYFSKYFKKHTQLTPTQYRDTQRLKV